MNVRPESSDPSEASNLERAMSLCNMAMFTVALQHRRLGTVEPEDKNFLFRELADFHFMITALAHLRKSATIAARIPTIKKRINRAIKEFDTALPALTKMRDVLEHIDDYALNRGKHPDVQRQQLQVATWSSRTYDWLGVQFSADSALAAAEQLFKSVVDSVKQYNPK